MTDTTDPALEFDVMVVGGGAVGLACAAKLARLDQQVLLVERHLHFGFETSSRNSGVVHAGLYYPTGSLKASLCRRGKELLYSRCERDGISHARCGKLVVAVEDAELPALHGLHAQALRNGATEVRLLDQTSLLALEPNVRAVMALWSPDTGIVDTHGLMTSYRREAQAHDAVLLLGHRFLQLQSSAGVWLATVHDERAGGTLRIAVRSLVNAAGLGACAVAERCGVDIPQRGLRQHYCKGDYFRLASHLRGAVRHLVYPMPVAAGLGIHLTMDLAGQLSAGPDTEYVPEPRYDVDPTKAALFAQAVQRYLPALQLGDLSPNYAGVRPKLQGPGEGFADFMLLGPEQHDLAGQVHLLGIESPGLTASEAIAERVCGLLVPQLPGA